MMKYRVRDRFGRVLGEVRAADLDTAKAEADTRFAQQVAQTPAGLMVELRPTEDP